MEKKSFSEKEIVTVSGSEENILRQFFILAEHWQSDLKFFADELQFLKTLIDKYFIWLTDEKNIADTQRLTVELVKLEKSRLYIEQKVENHLKGIAAGFKIMSSNYAQASRVEHGGLEVAFAAFVKDFRLIKREIFELTKRVMESEKDPQLLG